MKKDLTNQRFGHLVALYDTGKRMHRCVVWRFRCDCGRECEKPTNYVKDSVQSGYTPSCGECIEYSHPNNAPDISGISFGSLTAIQRAEGDKPGAFWEFRCICGRTVIKAARDVRSQLKEGHTPSCGRVECGAGHNPTRDYTGEQFGKLMAVEQRTTKKWLFRCQCGTEVIRNIQDVIGTIRDGYIPACESCGSENKRQFGLEDFTGQRFGALIALRPTKASRGNYSVWIFRCDCGREVERIPADVRAVIKRGHIAACPKCRKPANLLPGDDAVIHRVWHQYNAGARNRNLEFELSVDDVRELVLADCVYCGAKPSRFFKRGPKSTSLLVNGIDRLHNHLGYVRGNVVPCCWACNRMKRDMPYEEWCSWIERIAKHQARGNNEI